MRRAISFSRGERSRLEKKARVSRIDFWVTSWIFKPLILTKRLSFLRRAPWQAEQERKFMYFSISSRMISESVSRYLRSRLGMTPSKSR